MVKVTKELHQQLVNAGVYTPRHVTGCPKNYSRILPTLLAAKGYSVEEIKRRVRQDYDAQECKCEEIKKQAGVDYDNRRI